MIIFVGGTGRSGTTILSKLLGQNREILALPVEARFLTDPGGLVDLYLALSINWSPYGASEALLKFKYLMSRLGHKPNRLERFLRNQLDRLNITYRKYYQFPLGYYLGEDHFHRVLNHFFERLASRSFQGYWAGNGEFVKNPRIQVIGKQEKKFLALQLSLFVKELLTHQLTIQSKNRWVEHSPQCILQASVLKEIFPGAKFIHIRRDLRDLVASFLDKKWGGDNHDDVITWIKSINQQWNQEKAKLHSDDYLEIWLEDLLTDKKTTISEICKFLQIEPESSMIDFPLREIHYRRQRKTDPDIDKLFSDNSSLFYKYRE